MNSKIKFKVVLFAFLSFVFCSNIAFSQNKKGKGENEKQPSFKKYEELIPDSAITKEGVFTVHEVGDKVYYEVKRQQLGKEFLWLTQFEGIQTSFGYGGVEVIRRVVRWERFQDYILLRNVEYFLRADKGTPESLAVKASSVEQIIYAFKIESFSKEKNPVIDVTDFFTGDVHEFSPKEQLDATGVDKSRTFISSVKTFEKNIETKVLATYKLKPDLPSKPGEYSKKTKHTDPSLGSVTVELHHSMVELPEKLMRPRIFDERVGYFAGSHQDFSTGRHQVEEVEYIRRWRLEKKNPGQEVSEPVKPIVYYVGREIPEKWHSYIIEGIEMWQPVFEAAGFKNAIIGKMAPTKEEDPDFDAEDARYSTIRWLPSTIANAYGPHVQDPRTGEILEADIRIFHNVLSLIRDWYFVQASPSDPRAQKIPMPDEVIGEALRYVVAHEVGHTLGLRHNFKSTYYYDVEKYRDPEFTNKYGLEASIMDYGRFNYIAQPGDGAATIPTIAPYDYFAIEWGYSEFTGTKTAEDDIPYLNKIAERQLDEPMLRFGGGRENGIKGSGDPHARTEDLGNDPIKATTYGLKNIEYISGYLVKACGEKDKNYDMLNHLYDALLKQMYTELEHVGALVGGIEVDNLVYGQSADVYTPTPVKEQKEAVKFLLEKGFKTPDYLIKKDIITRIGMYGVSDKISSYQKKLLVSMLNEPTANRILDLEATKFDNYKLVELVNDMKNGIFSELTSTNPEIDIYRRNLQRAFVEQLISFIDKEDVEETDLQAVARGTLVLLRNDIRKQMRNNKQSIEYYHFLDLSEMIKLAMEK